MSTNSRAQIGVERILSVFARRADRPSHGLMQHEFRARFKSDGWTMTDFRAAMQVAFDAGWVEIDAQFYRLTEAGRDMIEATAPVGDRATVPAVRDSRKALPDLLGCPQ